MSKEETKLIGQATLEQIEAWKEEHKNLFKVEVDGHVAYFKKPNRHVLAAASKSLQDSPLQYVDDLLTNTFVGGSREVLDNDDYFLAAVQVVDDLVEVKTAELTKL